MHGDRDPSIAGMVLDSPFSDLARLCEEMVDKARDQGINVPGFGKQLPFVRCCVCPRSFLSH